MLARLLSTALPSRLNRLGELLPSGLQLGHAVRPSNPSYEPTIQEPPDFLTSQPRFGEAKPPNPHNRVRAVLLRPSVGKASRNASRILSHLQRANPPSSNPASEPCVPHNQNANPANLVSFTMAASTVPQEIPIRSTPTSAKASLSTASATSAGTASNSLLLLLRERFPHWPYGQSNPCP